MNYEHMQKWLDEQIQKANDYRTAKGQPVLNPLEESNLRDRLRLMVAR